jgi:ABC-type uncharacterized transport system ATPase subunit
MSDRETITINVDRNLSKKFRKLAAIRYGKRKGYLGKAIDNAIRNWMTKQESEDVDISAIEELRKGYYLGGIKYKSKGELHER